MKVKVAVPVFKNKETGTYHKKGAILSITRERFDEIRKAGPFVEPLEADKAESKAEGKSSKQEAPAEEPEPDPEPGPLHSFEGVPYIEQERAPGH